VITGFVALFQVGQVDVFPAIDNMALFLLQIVQKLTIMDDKNKRGPQDASRVNVHEDYELRYWTERFNISADELRAAVTAAGPSVSAIEAYLKGRR
jgi:hypothetical protein